MNVDKVEIQKMSDIDMINEFNRRERSEFRCKHLNLTLSDIRDI